MLDFDEVLEQVLDIKTVSDVNILGYTPTLRTLTAEQKRLSQAINDDIDEFIQHVNSNGIVYRGQRLSEVDGFTYEKLLEVWNFEVDGEPVFSEDLPMEVAKEICSLSGLDFPEFSEDDLDSELEEAEPLGEEEMKQLSPTGEPVAS